MLRLNNSYPHNGLNLEYNFGGVYVKGILLDDFYFNHTLNPFIIRLTFSDIVTSVFTSIGVFPTARARLNGHLHKRFSAMIVTAFQLGKSIDIPTRKLYSYPRYRYFNSIHPMA